MHSLLAHDQRDQLNSVVGICNTKMQNETVTIAAWAMHEETHVTRLHGLLMSMRWPPVSLYHFAFLIAECAQCQARNPENM